MAEQAGYATGVMIAICTCALAFVAGVLWEDQRTCNSLNTDRGLVCLKMVDPR